MPRAATGFCYVTLSSLPLYLCLSVSLSLSLSLCLSLSVSLSLCLSLCLSVSLSLCLSVSLSLCLSVSLSLCLSVSLSLCLSVLSSLPLSLGGFVWDMMYLGLWSAKSCWRPEEPELMLSGWWIHPGWWWISTHQPDRLVGPISRLQSEALIKKGGINWTKWVNSYGSGLCRSLMRPENVSHIFTHFFFACFCSFCIILSLHELYGVSMHACGYSSLYSPSPGKFLWCTVCRFGSMIPWSSLIYILNSTTIPGLRIQGWPSPQGPSPSGIFSSSPVHVSPVRVIHRSRWQPKWRQLMVLAGPSCS